MILSAHFFQDVEDIEMTAGNEVEPDHVEVRANRVRDIFHVILSAHFFRTTRTSR